MDAKRRGEIAELAIEQRFRTEGVKIGPNFRRELGAAAKAMGITLDEALEFVEPIVRKLVDETFDRAKAGASDGKKKEEDKGEDKK